MMSSIHVLTSNLVYRNSMSHVVSRHAYFPSVVTLKNNQLVCAMDIGSAFESVDMRSYVCHSIDNGNSWSEPEIIFHPDESDHPVSTTCRINKTNRSNGELMGWACLFDRTHTNQGFVNSKTHGFVNTDFATVTSEDNGKSWSAPKLTTLPMAWPAFECCYPVYPLDGQRMIVPASPWPSWTGKPAPQPNGLAWLSDDGGETWATKVETFSDAIGGLKAYEQKFTTLADGRLLAVCWSFDEAANANRPNHFAISNDCGQTFSPAQSTLLNGETCSIVGLENNRVLCAYRRYDEKPGLWGHLAKIEGTQWIPVCDQQLWSGHAYGESNIDNKVDAMTQLRCGCPSMVRLPNGDVFLVFWAVEDCVSNIRWIKLGVEL